MSRDSTWEGVGGRRKIGGEGRRCTHSYACFLDVRRRPAATTCAQGATSGRISSRMVGGKATALGERTQNHKRKQDEKECETEVTKTDMRRKEHSRRITKTPHIHGSSEGRGTRHPSRTRQGCNTKKCRQRPTPPAASPPPGTHPSRRAAQAEGDPRQHPRRTKRPCQKRRAVEADLQQRCNVGNHV